MGNVPTPQGGTFFLFEKRSLDAMLPALLARRPTELNPTEPLAANNRAAELRQVMVWGSF